MVRGIDNSKLSHAVVIGAGISGLAAARVLAHRFELVTVVERDTPKDAPVPRPGVPQSKHVHALLKHGEVILEQLFPELTLSLVSAGASTTLWTRDTVFHNFAGQMPRSDLGISTLSCSRPLLELMMRQQLLTASNVRIIPSTEVVDIVLAPNGRKVRGVTLRQRSTSTSRVNEERLQELNSDLIVDASGRSSRAAAWLARLGGMRPRESTISSHFGYASQVYEIPEDKRPDWKVILVQGTPPLSLRGGTVQLIERGKWIVSLVGAARDYPPRDSEGFLSFAHSLPNQGIFEFLCTAQPASPIVGTRVAENKYVHFEDLKSMPDGFVVLGDAVCAPNPVFGQGMTIAALSAMTLHNWLSDRLASGSQSSRGTSLSFQRSLARAYRIPWVMAATQDSRYADPGHFSQGWIMKPLQLYIDTVLGVCANDADTLKVFLQVVHMIAPPASLFHPWLLARAIRQLSHRALSH